MTDQQRQDPEADAPETRPEGEEIHRVSPEGEPAHPEIKPNTLQPLIWIIPVALLLLALVVAFIASPLAALAIAVLAVLALLYNPIFHTVRLRNKEREQIQRGDPKARLEAQYPKNEPAVMPRDEEEAAVELNREKAERESDKNRRT